MKCREAHDHFTPYAVRQVDLTEINSKLMDSFFVAAVFINSKLMMRFASILPVEVGCRSRMHLHYV